VVEYQRLFHVLFGSALLVLALACVNAAGLLLVRGAGRAHEAAVRRALGAGRLRLVSQMLAEAAVIGAATALISLTLAEGAAEILRRVVPTLLGGAPMWWRFALDGPSVLLALGAALVTTLGAGLVPAVRAARVSIDPLLRDGQRDTGLHASHLVRWLVVAEIALSSALLSAAGLVIRSGANLGEGDVGVPTAGFLISFVDLPPRYQERGQRQFIQELTERLDSIPGVESASISTSPPGCTPYWNELYTLGARSPARMEELPSVGVVQVTPGFFESFRIPVQGRTPLNSDAWGRPTVAVVSESLARSAWPGEDAIGKEIRIAPQEGWLPWATVVGVAKDVRYDERLRAVGTMPPVVYISMLQWPTRQLTVALRAARNPAAAAEKIRQAVWSIDPDVPVSTARSLDDQRRRNAARLTLIGRMFMAFGAVTLALAATGVYGVLAHSVAQRERELAIRRALGASGVHLALAVLLRSGWQLLLGLALGLALAPTMGAMVGSALGQPGPSLRIYLGVAVGLSVVLGIAALIPVRRALSLDPSAALRQT
jgi:putative ABC transport system permease protein